MTYHVRLIGEEQLPADYSWAMVRTLEDCIFFVKPEGLTPRILEDAWSAYALLNCSSVAVAR